MNNNVDMEGEFENQEEAEQQVPTESNNDIEDHWIQLEDNQDRDDLFQDTSVQKSPSYPQNNNITKKIPKQFTDG